MALPLTTANEIHCISHVRYHTSPLADALRLPKLRKTSVDSSVTLDVSTAIVWRHILKIFILSLAIEVSIQIILVSIHHYVIYLLFFTTTFFYNDLIVQMLLCIRPTHTTVLDLMLPPRMRVA